MSYYTLMVDLEFGAANRTLLEFTANLAECFNAEVIGIAACHPMQVMFGNAYLSADLIEQGRREIDKKSEATEAAFHAAFQGRTCGHEWRSTVTYTSLADFVAQEARAADLLITGPERRGSPLASTRLVNLGDLVMSVGRPVLIVPAKAEKLDLQSVVVGWKESREARRAVADALPLLKKASHVTVVEIIAAPQLPIARDRLKDVVDWLKRHDIAAESLAAPSKEDDATQLDAIAVEKGAGLLVAGAYGHNRLREWMLGGVTRDLLLRPGRCSLVSH